MNERMKSILLLTMIISLVGSFVLFFAGYYMTGFVLGGVFIVLAAVLSQWASRKNADYMERNHYHEKEE